MLIHFLGFPDPRDCRMAGGGRGGAVLSGAIIVCPMATTTFHSFCILVLFLACICIPTGWSGACRRANDEHAPSTKNTGHPSANAELGLLPDKTTNDSPNQRALLERPGGGRRFSSIYGLLKSYIFDLCNPFIRKQASDQNPSKAELDHNVLFVFGDSLFDAGNNKYISDDCFTATHYPYGYAYFTNATGRRSDGRLAPDFIAEYANLPLIPPSLQPGADFTYGANFASAGSAVLDADSESSTHVINLKAQVLQFKEMARKFNETLGPRRAREMLRKAVYLISIGGNDYLTYYTDIIEEGRAPTQAEQQQFVKEVVGNLTNAIMEIYEQGVRKIAFQNVGPMGCLPMADTNGSCTLELLTMPMLHNEELYRVLMDLAESLEGFKFSVMDYFSSLYDRIMYPSKYGFDVGRTECYTSEVGAYRGAKGCDGGNSTLCNYPSAYVFFDGGHTTQSVNSQMARLMWSGDPSVTRPYNVKQLFEEE